MRRAFEKTKILLAAALVGVLWKASGKWLPDEIKSIKWATVLQRLSKVAIKQPIENALLFEAVSQFWNNQIRAQYRVYCLTPHPESLLMWAHYAESGKGYCLEFHGSVVWKGGPTQIKYMLAVFGNRSFLTLVQHTLGAYD